MLPPVSLPVPAEGAGVIKGAIVSAGGPRGGAPVMEVASLPAGGATEGPVQAGDPVLIDNVVSVCRYRS